MTEQEKQRIRKLFKSATNGLEYDRGVVLGSILGELMIKLDSTEREVKDYDDKVVDLLDKIHDMQSDNNRLSFDNQRLQKALEKIAQNDLPDHDYVSAVQYYEIIRIAHHALSGVDSRKEK